MKFQFYVGRDATAYFEATVEAETLEDAKALVSRSGVDCGGQVVVWTETGVECFDQIEVCTITAPDETMCTYTGQNGWEE